MQKPIEFVRRLGALDMQPAVKRELNAVLHKLRHPMKDILAKIPGATLTGKAKRLKVSRQTLYVWQSERFRPTRTQAKRIAKLTGVPVEHIVDDGWNNDAGRKTDKKAARMAAGHEKTAQRDGGNEPRRRGDGDAGNREHAA